MNAVLICRITDADSALAAFCEKRFSLARPVLLDARGPLIRRDALKDQIDCDCLGCELIVWDGLQLTVWFHDDDLDAAAEEVIEREIACEVTCAASGEVFALLEGPLVITGPVTADGVIGMQESDAQAMADRVNSGMPLRGAGGTVLAFTELLALSELY